MATHTTTARSSRVEHRDLLRTVTAVVGGTFLLVGIAGFIPGITENVGDIEFAGHESGAELLGIFQVSILHNLVHVAFGIGGLIAARRPEIARGYLILGGVAYLVLWLYGLAVEQASDGNFVPVNTADDWLHFALGLGMLGAGFLLPRATGESRPAPTLND